MAAVVAAFEATAARTELMRALSPSERAAAIAGADNVVGYDRFTARARDEMLRRQSPASFQGKRP